MQGSSSTILKIAGMRPSNILLLNSSLNQPTKYGNFHWYLALAKSYGFAATTTTVNCAWADHSKKDNSKIRLHWRLNCGSGYCAGAVMNLGKNNKWREIIITKKITTLPFFFYRLFE